MVGEGFKKKIAALLDFVQITSTPPPPNLDNLYHSYWTPMCQTTWAGVSPSPHPQIDPIYTVCEKWTKSERIAPFFGKLSLTNYKTSMKVCAQEGWGGSAKGGVRGILGDVAARQRWQSPWSPTPLQATCTVVFFSTSSFAIALPILCPMVTLVTTASSLCTYCPGTGKL